MTTETKSPTENPSRQDARHFDVLIVGAGISGLGAAYELKKSCPSKSFAILEGMESFGGTWLWHKYPGIRSDSDLFTFGYHFKPWLGTPIASRDEILKYLGEVISENDLAQHIHFNQRVQKAIWCSKQKLWTIQVQSGNETAEFTCNFLWMCQGYYRHAEGYTPQWQDMEKFAGPIIHPQTWPEDTDYRDKRVVVIGSGATAATIVPALAGDCEHVTMLQRSPTYFAPGVNRNKFADTLRDLDVDPFTTHDLVRRKITRDQIRYLHRALDEPDKMREELQAGVAEYLSEDQVQEHFTPSYRPWQQRIAVVPDGDLFKAMQKGDASVVTDQIDRFTEKGILLESGTELEADIIITATGFNLCVMGDITFVVDGNEVDFAETINYRGVMFTGIPNMAWIMGYLRSASWTLKVDLVAGFISRLLNHMDEKGVATVQVKLRPEDADMALEPWLREEIFNPGYFKRGGHLLPKGGDKEEWRSSQDYWIERDVLPVVDLDDPIFVYETKA
jgi:cation diffusion facilitator CzcD-associated flavoprotein CzcO